MLSLVFYLYGFGLLGKSLLERGVNLAKQQSLKMCNFSFSLSICLKVSLGIAHYKIFAWVNFCGCSLKVEVGMT